MVSPSTIPLPLVQVCFLSLRSGRLRLCIMYTNIIDYSLPPCPGCPKSLILTGYGPRAKVLNVAFPPSVAVCHVLEHPSDNPLISCHPVTRPVDLSIQISSDRAENLSRHRQTYPQPCGQVSNRSDQPILRNPPLISTPHPLSIVLGASIVVVHRLDLIRSS